MPYLAKILQQSGGAAYLAAVIVMFLTPETSAAYRTRVQQKLSALCRKARRRGRLGLRNHTVVAHIPDVSTKFLDHSFSHEAHSTQAQAYATFEETPN